MNRAIPAVASLDTQETHVPVMFAPISTVKMMVSAKYGTDSPFVCARKTFSDLHVHMQTHATTVLVRTEVVAESIMKVMMLQEKYLLLVVVLSSSKVTVVRSINVPNVILTPHVIAGDVNVKRTTREMVKLARKFLLVNQIPV